MKLLPEEFAFAVMLMYELYLHCLQHWHRTLVKLRLVPSHLDVCSPICRESWDFFCLLVFWAVVRSDSTRSSFWIIFHCVCLSKLQINKFSIPFLQAASFWLDLILQYYSSGGMCLSFKEESLWDVCRWTATNWIQIKLPQPECGALSCCHFTFTLQLILFY